MRRLGVVGRGSRGSFLHQLCGLARSLNPNSRDIPVVAGGNLKNPVKESTNRMPAKFDGMIDGLGIPTSRHSRSKQRFHFRREIKRFLVEGVEKRLDAEAVAGGEDRPVGFIPEYKSKFASQSVQALSPRSS